MSDPTSSPFASLVSEAMSRQGLGLRALCRAVELDPSFFSKVLSGKRSPPAEEPVLRRIAAVLELDPVRLVLSTGRLPAEMRSLWSQEKPAAPPPAPASKAGAPPASRKGLARRAPDAPQPVPKKPASAFTGRRRRPVLGRIKEIPLRPGILGARPQLSEELL